MRYALKSNPEIKISVVEAKKRTIIEHEEYGNITVEAGDFVLTRVTNPKKGEKVGITKTDLELQYEPVEE